MARPAKTAGKSTSRQRKLECGSCGFICYASAGAVQRAGLPTCGCGAELSIAHVRDLAVIDPDGFDSLAQSMPTRGAYNAIMRECGFDDCIIRDRSSDPMSRARAAVSRRATMQRRAVWAKQDSEMPF